MPDDPQVDVRLTTLQQKLKEAHDLISHILNVPFVPDVNVEALKDNKND